MSEGLHFFIEKNNNYFFNNIINVLIKNNNNNKIYRNIFNFSNVRFSKSKEQRRLTRK